MSHAHRPLQHRDGRPPWCPACGLTEDYSMPRSRFDTLTGPPEQQERPRSARIRLPYRTPPLSLNQRGHWATHARGVKTVRRDVAWIIRAQRLTPFTRLRVQLGYTPRDARRRDTDNLVATLKAVADGLVDAGLVPDDTPQYMAKPEPVITAPDSRDPHLWLLLTEISPKGGS